MLNQESNQIVSVDDEAEIEWRWGFALRLRAIFVLRDMTSGTVGNDLDVSASRVSNWLGGLACPQGYVLHLLSRRYDISLEYLLNDDPRLLPEHERKALNRGPAALIKKLRPDLAQYTIGP